MTTQRGRRSRRPAARSEQTKPAYLDEDRGRAFAAPSAAQIEFALEAAQVGTWTSDLTTGDVTWDECNYRLFGRPPGDFSADFDGFMALVHPDDRSRVRGALRQAHEGGLFDVEFRVVHPDGSLHVLAGRGKLERDENGRAVKFVGANWDVTERRRAEEALHLRQMFISTIGRLSTEFITAGDEELERLTAQTLEQLGKFTEVDRVRLLLSSEDGTTITPSHVWVSTEIAAPPPRRSTLDWALYLQRLGGGMRLRRLAELPASAAAARPLLEADVIDGLLTLPLGPTERPTGLVTFECVGRAHEWRDEDVALLRAATEMLTHAVERRQTATDLKRRMKLDQVLSAISSSLLNVGDAAFDDAVCDALGLVSEFVGSDGVSLALFSRGGARCEVTHIWPKPPPGTPPLVTRTADVPWLHAHLERETLVTVTDTEQMPPDAMSDRRVLNALNIRAMASAALISGEALFGIISAVGGSPRAQWRHDETLLMRMAGEMITVEIRRRREAYASATLAKVGQDLIRLIDTPSIAARVCELVAETLHGDACILLMQQEESSRYRPFAQHGLSGAEWKLVSVLRFDGLASDSSSDNRSGPESAYSRLAASALEEIEHRLGLGGGTCLPLTAGTGCIGVLVAFVRQTSEPLGEAQGDLFRRISQMAAFGLTNARLLGELEQANRVKSDFIATMSHELRTPLNIILGYSDLLLDDVFGALNETQRGTVQRVLRSGRGLLDLIEATLDVARLDAGRAVLELSDVDISLLLGELASEVTLRFDKPAVDVRWEVPPSLPLLRTDAAKLKLVLRNVVDNAVKFTREGFVHVRAAEQDEGIAFTVTDTGVGIAPEALSIVFESFRQADQSTTREFGGVGLGLYIVRRILDLLGGTVDVASEVGRGSCFTVWLPTPSIERG